MALMTTTTKTTDTDEHTACFHCGEPCIEEKITIEDKSFCCQGCKMVYEVLNTNDLGQFYCMEDTAVGLSQKGKQRGSFTYLDDETIVEQLIDFQNDKIVKVTFHLPQIHCASCVWLLENLYRINDAIFSSKVNFLKKEITVTYSKTGITFRNVVEILAAIGYEPAINMGNLSDKKSQLTNKQFYYQLGVAGFAFGNIMLFSFPEYLGLKDTGFQQLFSYLNVVLILPVLFYSGKDYWQSAWNGLKQKYLNIDVPITLGMFTLFGRSIFEIFTQTGVGYLDSLAGLVFFLLIGKWFQQVTYHQLSFERDYKSYFPIAANTLIDGVEQSVAISKLKVGDIIILRHGELIPTDGLLTKGTAYLDYSFVTGESATVKKEIGEKVYAGGKHKGASIEITVSKAVEQSYLTQLWNEDAFQKSSTTATSDLADRIGRYFTIAILAVAFVTLAYWLPKDMSLAINAFTAVLIIACPCAVALSIPFTFGNVLRLLGRSKFYLKNTSVIEQLTQIDTIVFDKTGTITQSAANQLRFEGENLALEEKQAIKALASQSTHPVSRQIVAYLKEVSLDGQRCIDFEEITGKGLVGKLNDKTIRIEKQQLRTNSDIEAQEKGTAIWINDQLKGVFISQNQYRDDLTKVLEQLGDKYNLAVLSGDNDRERERLSQWFEPSQLHFEQSPKDKLQYIQQRQANGEKVLMIGDGLNDAGALQQANIGIVIAENTNNFTPACDAILEANSFGQLPAYFRFAHQSLKVVYAAYFLALIYNIIGLSFAVQGTLSPVIAAILMPLSSITIVVFGVGMTFWLGMTKVTPSA